MQIKNQQPKKISDIKSVVPLTTAVLEQQLESPLTETAMNQNGKENSIDITTAAPAAPAAPAQAHPNDSNHWIGDSLNWQDIWAGFHDSFINGNYGSFTRTITNNSSFSFDNLTIVQHIGFINILLSILILLNIHTIISILYGNFLIEKYELSKRYPLISKYIFWRLWLNKYGLIFSIFITVLTTLILLIFNLYLLTQNIF